MKILNQPDKWLLVMALGLAHILCRADQMDDEIERIGKPHAHNVQQVHKYLVDSMQKVRKAAELYASYHGGRYPQHLDLAFKSFFPFGNCDDKSSTVASLLTNPFTRVDEWPIEGHIADVDKARREAPGKVDRGRVEYSSIHQGQDYAIRVGDADGIALSGAQAGHKEWRTFVVSRDDAQALMANMRVVQIAAESYFEDCDRYPSTLAELKLYFPGGNAKTKVPGRASLNPYTHTADWPVIGHITDLKLARKNPREAMKPGAIEYSCLEGGKNYAIRSGGKDGKTLVGLGGPTSTLVLAKDGDGAGHGW